VKRARLHESKHFRWLSFTSWTVAWSILPSSVVRPRRAVAGHPAGWKRPRREIVALDPV